MNNNNKNNNNNNNKMNKKIIKEYGKELIKIGELWKQVGELKLYDVIRMGRTDDEIIKHQNYRLLCQMLRPFMNNNND